MGKYSLNKLPSDILKEIAAKVKILRKEAAISQLKLAKKSGVSHGSIKRFEQSGQISFESLLKITHVLDRLNEFETIFESNKKDITHLFSNKTRQ